MNLELIIRLLFGFPFVYLVSGFPLARLFLPDEKRISLKLLLTSFAFSLFLTYPAGVLTTILEGQSATAIYSIHLPHSLFSLGLIFLITFLILIRKSKNWWKLSMPKITKSHVILSLIILHRILLRSGSITGRILIINGRKISCGIYSARTLNASFQI